jgi:predicted nuclease of predicted toxin-antitoxin system
VRFVVDQCVPAEVGRWLANEGHEAWTADAAGLNDAADEDLLAYSNAKGAILITTNRDCAQLGRRLRSAPVVWLAVRESDAKATMARAMAWLASMGSMPNGRVLRVSKVAAPKLLNPRPLH